MTMGNAKCIERISALAVALGMGWWEPPHPRWRWPGTRDVLGRTDEIADRGANRVMTEMHRPMGGDLLNLPHQRWLPRRCTLQLEAGR